MIKSNSLNSIAHITGGGILENLERVIPGDLVGVIDNKNFKIPKKFLWLKELAKCSKIEMLKTFNCGIGMILITNKNKSKRVLKNLKNKNVKFHIMGRVEKKIKKKSNVEIRNFGEWALN